MSTSATGCSADDEAADADGSAGAVPEIRLGSGRSRSCWRGGWTHGEAETQWFARHGSTPITEIPAHWPEEYRTVVEQRIE